MEIVLIRHAQPEWVKDGLNVDNPPLTELGFRQAQMLADSFVGQSFDEVHVSPLVRTRQTAEPFLHTVGHDESIAPWLEEIRNPIWHGTPEEKAAEAWRAERLKSSHEKWSGIEGGEPVDEFVARINEGAAGFLSSLGLERADNSLPVWHAGESFVDDRRIALVCHAGTSSVAICHFLGLEPTPWEWERFVIGHATVNVVRTMRLGDGVTFGLSLLSGNDHLPVGMRTY